MSSQSFVVDGLGAGWECGLSGEVIDGLTDGVTSRTDAVARAEVVAEIVLEIVEAVRWRCADQAGAEEIAGLLRLHAAAEAHRDRMRALTVPPSAHPTVASTLDG